MDSNSKNNIKFAGEFRIDVANIISYRSSDADASKAFRYNIRPQLLSFSIIEDLSLPSLTGELYIADAQDIRTALPLTGMERLELKFYNPGTDLTISTTEEDGDPLYIYKIEKIRQSGGTGRQQVYKLFFTSREVYRNMTRRISRAFAGPIENAVYQIVKDKKYLDSRKNLIIEETSTNAKYVIPNLRPLKAIDFLAASAVSKRYANAGYLFYETTQAYHFRSFESLLAIGGSTARTVKEKYDIQPAAVREGGNKNIEKDLRNVESYSFEDSVNMIEQLENGLYANRLVTNDIYNKRIESFNFDYHDSFGDFFHTEHFDGEKAKAKYLWPDTMFDITEKRISEHYDTKLLHYVQTAKTHNDYEFVPCKNTVQKRLSQREQMANFHLVMTVPGQVRLNAGDLISFSLPKQAPIRSDEKMELNPYYSGRYLILQLRHEFDVQNQKHMMTMRCVKDAAKTELPYEHENLITLREKNKVLETTVQDLDNSEIMGG